MRNIITEVRALSRERYDTLIHNIDEKIAALQNTKDKHIMRRNDLQ